MSEHPYKHHLPSSDRPIGNSPLDAALVVIALRKLIVAWRERASVAPERESRVYQRVEADVTALIASHSEARAVWQAARDDLMRALLAALDQRGGDTT